MWYPNKSQTLYNVAGQIQQIGCHVYDLIKNTCPCHSSDVSIHLLTLKTKISFFTHAFIWSYADTPVSTGWFTFCCKNTHKKLLCRGFPKNQEKNPYVQNGNYFSIIMAAVWIYLVISKKKNEPFAFVCFSEYKIGHDTLWEKKLG